MPRKKTFTIEFALTKALELFRARGYRATSMRDIAKQTGVSRSSVYATFGNKHALFLQALRHDGQVTPPSGLPNLTTATPPRQAIIEVFESVGESQVDHNSLLINTAIELLPKDVEVAAAVRNALTELEARFCSAVERGIAGAEIDRRVDATQAARCLLTLFLGLQVLARSRPDAALLRAVVTQAESLLPAA